MAEAKTKMEPVAWQWRTRDWGGKADGTARWSSWQFGRLPSTGRPMHEDREERPLYAAPQPADVAEYVHTAPDHCDRIVWRGIYHQLPLATPAPSTTTEEALRALIDETGSKDAENMADMARIGHACMEEIERLDRAYSNCPSEVIVDLANALDEAERGRDDAIATVLAADDTRQAATELGAENARLRAAAQAVLDAETVNVHVGYDNAAGGGNFVYADAIRTDDEAFTKLRTALSR